MLSRRELLMLGGAAGAPAPREISAGDLNVISNAMRDLRHLTESADVTQVQDRQRTHFKINQRFPNYIDIGLMVWERLYTWHLENHLPLKASRTPEGRVEMEFMFTTLVLRWDMAESLIGVPYD